MELSNPSGSHVQIQLGKYYINYDRQKELFSATIFKENKETMEYISRISGTDPLNIVFEALELVDEFILEDENNEKNSGNTKHILS
jgi:hypothetical protein